jgi:hypothetical protein
MRGGITIGMAAEPGFAWPFQTRQMKYATGLERMNVNTKPRAGHDIH